MLIVWNGGIFGFLAICMQILRFPSKKLNIFAWDLVDLFEREEFRVVWIPKWTGFKAWVSLGLIGDGNSSTISTIYERLSEQWFAWRVSYSGQEQVEVVALVLASCGSSTKQIKTTDNWF